MVRRKGRSPLERDGMNAVSWRVTELRYVTAKVTHRVARTVRAVFKAPMRP